MGVFIANFNILFATVFIYNNLILTENKTFLA